MAEHVNLKAVPEFQAQVRTRPVPVVPVTTGSGSTRSVVLGVGIPSAPVISLKPGSQPVPDLYVTVSGGAGMGASTMRADINPVSPSNRTNLLYWRDRRLQ